jgi:hypothetical protein
MNKDEQTIYNLNKLVSDLHAELHSREANNIAIHDRLDKCIKDLEHELEGERGLTRRYSELCDSYKQLADKAMEHSPHNYVHKAMFDQVREQKDELLTKLTEAAVDNEKLRQLLKYALKELDHLMPSGSTLQTKIAAFVYSGSTLQL